MTNAYRNQAQLGADRWAAMLGLRMRLPAGHPPALLASFGTATTLDTLARTMSSPAASSCPARP